MKLLRIWLLVLLAVLLPVRGAVAAVMFCPPATTMNSTGTELGHGHHHETLGAADHDSGGPEKCNLCCDLCSMTPMLGTLPAVPLSQNVSMASFPDLFTPAPSFLSDGQERPPRSI